MWPEIVHICQRLSRRLLHDPVTSLDMDFIRAKYITSILNQFPNFYEKSHDLQVFFTGFFSPLILRK